MTHVARKEARAPLEVGEPVAGAVEDPRLRDRVPVVIDVAEGSKVGSAQKLGSSLEVDAVRRERDPGRLTPSVGQEPVEVHPDTACGEVDVHVGGGDVRTVAAGREEGLGEAEASRLVHGPGAAQLLGSRESDVSAAVVGEVEVVAPKRLLEPGRCRDQRGPVDVRAQRGAALPTDDGVAGKPAHADAHDRHP